MDIHKRNLKGSPSRDAFKLWHKQLPSWFYACDLDFVLVSKRPPGIVAVLDYKKPADDVTFSEVLAYNALLAEDIPVFIVVGDEPFEELEIYKYLGGNWRPDPPKVEMELVAKTKGHQDFQQFERDLRMSYRRANGTNPNGRGMFVLTNEEIAA